MPDSLTTLEAQRSSLIAQFSELGGLRRGSITGTGGRCGNPNCHCHAEGDPGHELHSRLTYKIQGKDHHGELRWPGGPAESGAGDR
jgi:hypothetical protein